MGVIPVMKDGLVGSGNHSNNNSNNTTGIADDCNCTTSIQPMDGVFLGGWLCFMILIYIYIYIYTIYRTVYPVVPEVLLAVV